MSLAFRAVVLTLALLPDRLAGTFASIAGTLSATVPSRRLRLIRINVDKVLGLPPQAQGSDQPGEVFALALVFCQDRHTQALGNRVDLLRREA